MRWFLLISLVVTLSSARKFTKCELTNRLKSQSTPEVIRKDYKMWVCLAFKNAGYNTRTRHRIAAHGVQLSEGLFGLGKNLCPDIPASNFTDDNITDDLQCVAQVIQKRGGYGGESNNKFNEPSNADTCLTKEGCDVNECKNLDQCSDFWDVGACVLPESCVKKDVCSACNRDTCQSTTLKDLVVLKLGEVDCCGPQYRKKRTPQYGIGHYGGNNLEDKFGSAPPTHYGHGGPYPGYTVHPTPEVGQKFDHPKLDPLVIGCDDPDFIFDGCERNEIRHEDDNKCYGVLSNGPCGIEGMVLVRKTTKKGFCAPRLCGPDRIFLAKTQLCHDPRQPDLCERPDHILYLDMYGEPVCGCHNGFYEKDNKCHQILTETDICPTKGEVFWFESFRRAPTCLPDPCKGDNINRAPNQLPYAPDKDGKCHQLNSKCIGETYYFLNMEKLEGFCERLDEVGFIIYTPAEFVRAKELYGPFIHKGPRKSGPKSVGTPPASTMPVSLIPVLPVPNVIASVLPHYNLVHNMIMPIMPIPHHQGVILVNGSITNVATGYSGLPVVSAHSTVSVGNRKRRESLPSHGVIPYKSHHRQKRQWNNGFGFPTHSLNIYATNQLNSSPGPNQGSSNHIVSKRSVYNTGQWQHPIPVSNEIQQHHSCQNWNQQHQCNGAIIMNGR